MGWITAITGWLSTIFGGDDSTTPRPDPVAQYIPIFIFGMLGIMLFMVIVTVMKK